MRPMSDMAGPHTVVELAFRSFTSESTTKFDARFTKLPMRWVSLCIEAPVYDTIVSVNHIMRGVARVIRQGSFGSHKNLVSCILGYTKQVSLELYAIQVLTRVNPAKFHRKL